MARVQVLVGDEGNRAALSSLVDDRHEVVGDGDDIVDADLYLVDDRTLPGRREALLARKRDAHPTFCPVLLVRREDTHVSVELAAPDAAAVQLVDDSIAAPVDRTVLFRRLANLLARREQSIELTERYERTQARFRGLFQAIPDPAFVLDRSGTITEVNDAFRALADADREDLTGRPPADLAVFAGIEDGTLRDMFGETGGSPPDNLTLAGEDGSKRHLDVRRRTERVAGESNTVVVMYDVTDLTRANEQLEDFASIVTHDLRNPMTTAKARAGIVRDRLDDVPEAVADDLNVLQNSLERMNDLIEGVRTLVRETTVSDTRALPLDSVARDAWANVSVDDGRLRCVDDLTVEADENRLLQLFENLFRNAREHGEGEVTVEVGAVGGSGFYVADDGPGIPPEQRDDVLEAGFSTEGSGTGLGLKIVSEIAAAHGWALSIAESDAGGARFEITGVECERGD